MPATGPICANNGELLMQAAIGGAGIVLLPRFIVDEAVSRRALEGVLPEWQAPPIAVHAVYPSNRRMPLLYEFALKPGRVTFARLSQAKGRQSLVIAGGEMLDRPKSFTGTSGVVRFDRPAAEMSRRVIACGLEHHMALAYGEHRPALRRVAAALDLPVLEL